MIVTVNSGRDVATPTEMKFAIDNHTGVFYHFVHAIAEKQVLPNFHF